VSWRVIYHHEVADDLDSLGRHEARAVLKVIDERICNGSPEKAGKPLSGELAGCRRLRTGDVRIVYRVDAGVVEVLIIAVGPRRNQEVYKTARKRV
jgi:mRNA interferase RelE/StbE